MHWATPGSAHIASVMCDEPMEEMEKGLTLRICSRGRTELPPCWKCLPRTSAYVLYYFSSAHEELNTREMLLVLKQLIKVPEESSRNTGQA